MNRLFRAAVQGLVLLIIPLFTIPLFAGVLRSGDSLVLARDGGSGLVAIPADDPVIRFVESGGSGDAVVRVRLDQASRVLVLGASEERTLRLRDAFEPEALRGAQLQVEVLQGEGRVTVASMDLKVRAEDVHANRHRAVTPPAAAPARASSIALIDQAEAAGTINAETALLYRVYSEFDDASLPDQYRGDDSGILDSLVLIDVRNHFSALSAGAQDIVQRYLTPPAYKGSWANTSSGVTALAVGTPPPCDFFSDKWAYVDTANGLVRVWYLVDLSDEQRARDLGARIDSTIWPPIAALLAPHKPASDLSNACNGGDGRFDIYLAEVKHSETMTYKACDRAPRASFVLLKRTSTDVLAVHEIFHAFQLSYAVAGCTEGDDYRWWSEASAQWSEDYVIPPEKQEQGAAPDFLNVPEQPLDMKGQPHEWGSYLLPFYQYRRTGNADFVRKAWEASASQPALEAVNDALPGGFAAVWPEFVKYNWNQQPVDDYKKWDGLTAGAKSANGGVAAILAATPDRAITLKLGLPRLSATYKDFIFDDSVRTVAFWNGVTQNLVLRDNPPVGVVYASDPASADQTKGAHITALLRRKEQWTTEDWTNRAVVTFCRDQLADRVDELVLIISNSEFKDRGRKLEAPGLEPVLFLSNMGCWQWKGTSEFTGTDGSSTVSISTNVTWTRSQDLQTPAPLLYTAAGTETWRVSGDCNGSGTLTVDPELSSLLSLNFVPAEGVFNRGYYGFGTNGANRSVTVTCNGVSSTMTLLGWYTNPTPPPLGGGLPGSRFLRVNANGNVMGDTYDSPFGDGTTTWHFESQREP